MLLPDAATALPPLTSHLSRTLIHLTMTAVDKGWRVLICPDASFPGYGAEPVTWPALLAHRSVEGIKAGSQDVFSASDITLQPDQSLASLPATIAHLMGITSAPAHQPLFASLLPLTMTA
jgi:hypothetical protein